MNTIKFEYPECFTTGIIDESRPDLALCADALSAWGCVMMKTTIPECFGDVMTKIAGKIGVLGTPESFSEYANARLLN